MKDLKKINYYLDIKYKRKNIIFFKKKHKTYINKLHNIDIYFLYKGNLNKHNYKGLLKKIKKFRFGLTIEFYHKKKKVKLMYKFIIFKKDYHYNYKTKLIHINR